MRVARAPDAVMGVAANGQTGRAGGGDGSHAAPSPVPFAAAP